MKTIHIDATTIPDLWFQAVRALVEKGRKFTIDDGSFAGQQRLEFDYFTAKVEQPFFGSGTSQILPDIPAHLNIPNPVETEYVYGGEKYPRSYVEYILTDEVQENEQYTYGSRLRKYPYYKNHVHLGYIDQVSQVIESFRRKGFRSNQLVMQVGLPDDLLLDDPACLRHIQCRIQDNKLHFIIYFRSWDLWAGLPSNLAGLEALQSYMADCIGVEQGCFIISSAGLHIYDYAEELAKLRVNYDSEKEARG